MKASFQLTFIFIDVPILTDSKSGKDCVEFVQVALSLGKHLVKQQASQLGSSFEDIPDVVLMKNDTVVRLDRKKVTMERVTTKNVTNAQLHASVLIQRAIRKSLARKKMKQRKKSVVQNTSKM